MTCCICRSGRKCVLFFFVSFISNFPESWEKVSSSSSYKWLIPVRWMKSGGVQSDIWWLMEKKGVLWHASNIKCKYNKSFVVCSKKSELNFVSKGLYHIRLSMTFFSDSGKRGDEKWWFVGFGQHQHYWILPGKLWSWKLGTPHWSAWFRAQGTHPG